MVFPDKINCLSHASFWTFSLLTLFYLSIQFGFYFAFPRVEFFVSKKKPSIFLKIFIFLTWGGGSMKWNCNKSCTPKDLRRSTVFAKLVLWISGTVVTNNSSLYCLSVYNLKACPGPVRPALPDRWFALAWLIG